MWKEKKRQPIYMSKPAYNFLNHTFTSFSSTGQKVLQMCPSLMKLLPSCFRELSKNGYFTVRLTVRKGGISPLGPDRKQMWKFWSFFFIEIRFCYTQNTFYLIVMGLKNAYLMPLTPLLYRYLTILWQSSSISKKELGILVVGWKWLFWCKIHFRTHSIII